MTTRYESLYKSPNGPGDIRPTAHQIIQDENIQGKWSDKTILITGCSAGLGVETAKNLLDSGATLYLTARNLDKAKSTLGDIAKSDRIHLLELDLSSLASVKKCADAFLAQSDWLNILINDADVMVTLEGCTQDGFETQFGTNHVAHFLLIQLLLPVLLKSSTPDFQSRVVVLSSVAHRGGEVNFPNLTFEGQYHPWAAYAQSKTGNLWTAIEFERLYGNKGVHTWAVHPGGIMTGLMQHLSEEQVTEFGFDPDVGKMVKSAE